MLILKLGSQSLANATTAYLGIAGVGQGMGSFGHVFLIIRNSLQVSILISDLYQYTVTPRGNFNSYSPMDLIDPEKMYFHPEKKSFAEVLVNYTKLEDRTLSLYELNLDEANIQKLITLLNYDLEDTEFYRRFPYGIQNNCATRILELINEVVPSDKQIQIINHELVIYNPKEGVFKNSIGMLWNRLPYYLAYQLKNHPLSKGVFQIYERDTFLKAKLIQTISEDITQIQLICGLSKQSSQIILNYTYLFIESPDKYDLQPVINLLNNCKGKFQKIKVAYYLSLYQYFEPEQKSTKTKIAKLVNETLGAGHD